MNYRLTTLLWVPLAASAALAQEAVLPDPLPLAWCLERAAATNPQIAMVEASASESGARIVTAGAFEDPRISYDASNLPVDSFDFGSTPLSGHQLGLRQKLPFPGVRANRRRAAQAQHEASELQVEDQRGRIAGRVEHAWSELGFAQRALVITRRNMDHLRQLASVTESKYRVGQGLQQDVLRAQVELTSLLEEEITLQAMLAASEAALAELLDLPPDVAIPSTTSLSDDAPIPDATALLANLELQSPLLKSLTARITEAQKQLRVAELGRYPDLDVGIGYRIRENVAGDPVEGVDFFSAGVTVRLPVDFRKTRARVAEARARKRRAEAEYRSALASLRARLRTAHAELVRADAEQRLVATGLIPQAQQSFESSRSGYQVGRIDFLSLLDSQVSLLRAELREVRARADRRTAFAMLEATTGGPLR